MDKLHILFLTILTRGLVSVAEQWHEHESKSYFISAGPVNVNHYEAVAACEARESILAVVTSRAESNFLSGLTDQSMRYFIGYTGPTNCSCPGSPYYASCTTCRNQWRWIDGTESNYSDWALQRPLSGRGCAVLKGASTAGTMDATACFNHREYICQHKCMPDLCKKDSCEFVNDVYQCTCDADYTGTHCDTKIDDCEGRSCLNGASCIDGINSYDCVCASGFTGQDCETDINECEPQPCNNGACVDGINRFYCDCFNGYHGTHCEHDVDECASNPCKNGGTCIDLVNRYTCDCVKDDVDRNCQPWKSPTNVKTQEDLVVALSVLLSLCAVAFIVTLVLTIFYRYKLLLQQSKKTSKDEIADNDNYCKLQVQSNPVSTTEIYCNI